ncbi:MAG: DUF3071 domain-containing protein, partial [Actinobacteria bacterium]|nr:DUF3071 domain-containing protein [Actinomycetota bacterium]
VEQVRADAEPGQPEPAPDRRSEAAPAARETTDRPAAAPAQQAEAAQSAQPEHLDEPAARKPTRKRGRASVPSWDEIMFGGSKE